MRSAADDQVLHQAAHWFVQLSSEDRTEQDYAEWQDWRDRDPRHAEAWQQLEKLQARMRPVPRGMGRLLIQQPVSRRRVLGGITSVCIGLGAWAVASTQTDWLAPSQVLATQHGERRTLTLADGGILVMNTESQVVVRYGPQQRTVRLERGELQIRTAPDTQARARPFVVETTHGQIRALGTRFTVRTEASYTRVAVQEHAVLITPNESGPTLRLEAGQAANFSARESGREEPSPEEDSAWVHGQLIVLQQPLARFAHELSRYRAQPIVVDDRLAQLQVSGTFSLDDPDRSLRAGVAHLPVRLVVTETQALHVVPR